jgi:hypothetical protein
MTVRGKTYPREDKASGQIGLGFVKGFHLGAGAVASTIAHKSHNLLIVGTNEADMAFAGNALAKSGGGLRSKRSRGKGSKPAGASSAVQKKGREEPLI